MQALTSPLFEVTLRVWWRPAEISGFAYYPSNLRSESPPTLTIATHLLQHTGRIWSRLATVNHPDTARLQHIVSTNITAACQSEFIWLFALCSELTNVQISMACCVWNREAEEWAARTGYSLERTREMVSETWTECNLRDTWYHYQKDGGLMRWKRKWRYNLPRLKLLIASVSLTQSSRQRADSPLVVLFLH